MRVWKGIARPGVFLLFGIGIVWSCGFDSTLRAYLNARFWLPFSRNVSDFGRGNVKRVSMPFAGMTRTQDTTPLGKLRAAYQQISEPVSAPFDFGGVRKALGVARADSSVSPQEREEIDLIDAKKAICARGSLGKKRRCGVRAESCKSSSIQPGLQSS